MKSSTNKENFLPATFTVYCLLHFFFGLVVILSALAGRKLIDGMASLSMYLWVLEAVAIFIFVCVKLSDGGSDENI